MSNATVIIFEFVQRYGWSNLIKPNLSVFGRNYLVKSANGFCISISYIRHSISLSTPFWDTPASIFCSAKDSSLIIMLYNIL